MYDYIDFCKYELNEKTLSPIEASKHNYKYTIAAIQLVLSGQPIKIGANGEEEVKITSKNIDKKKFKDLVDKIKNKGFEDKNKTSKEINDSIVRAFNDCFISDKNGNKPLTWSKIYKGAFTNGGDGNEGNKFEEEVVADFEPYKKDIAKVLGIEPSALDGIKIDHEGGKNQARPFMMKDGLPFISKSTGDTITDVTLSGDNIPDKKVYLSLKYGNTLSIAGCGVNNDKLFPADAFTGDKEFGEQGKQFLKFMNVDEKLFRASFKSYNSENEQEDEEKVKQYLEKKYKDVEISKSKKGGFTATVTPDIDAKKLTEFAKSSFGEGYVMMHRNENGEVHYRDFRDKNNIDKLFEGEPKIKQTYYFNGSGKRNVITVEYPKVTLNFTFRSKTGSVAPSHLDVNYKFKD